jgi:hypothetical protein
LFYRKTDFTQQLGKPARNRVCNNRERTGMARSSILRAIKRGALSGTRQDDGTWLVDGAELARVFAVTVAAQATPHDAHSDPVAAVKLEAVQQRIADLERMLSDMRGERDDWKTQAQSVARQLAPPTLQDAQPNAQPQTETAHCRCHQKGSR